jgi:hypothetical protein
LREGAGLAAPTAPHATPPSARDRSGPARFWRIGRRAFVVATGFSAVLHMASNPWLFFPHAPPELRDTEGELTIAVELLGEEEAPGGGAPAEEPPAPADTPPPASPEADGPNARVDAGRPRDAGAPDGRAQDTADALDAGARISEADRDEDAGDDDAAAAVALAGDAGASEEEAGALAAGPPDDAGAVASMDAGAPGPSGARDIASLYGVPAGVEAGPQLVQLFVNMAVIRENPVGARIGPLLSAIPQWDDFMEGTNVDPVRDTDWLLIYGPSLIRTERDAILIRYSAPDAVVDQAITTISKKYDRGGAFDAGVPGVKATLGHADFHPRVFMRVQPKVLVVVPPDAANTFARVYSKAKISPRARPGEAMRLTLKNPHRPMPFVPETVSELRMWIVPNAEGGADVFAEGDAPSPAEAEEAARALRKFVAQQNSFPVRLFTKGVLNTVEFNASGSTVTMRGPVTREQLEALFAFVAGQLGVRVPAPPSPPTPP